MIYVIIALIFFFFILPRLAPYILRWLMRRQVKRMTRQFTERARQGAGEGGTPRGGAPAPTRRSKKIDPDVGEYVRFEEITVKQSARTGADDNVPDTVSSFKAEEQIVDVEWEDLPPEKNNARR